MATRGMDSTKASNRIEAHPVSSAAGGCRTAISVEFVTKPNQGQRVRGLVPKAIASTFEGMADFAGCAVMVSDQEERLITVLTFWQGELGGKALGENARWVCRLLEPYMDHKLRVQTMRSQVALVAASVAPGATEDFLGEHTSRVA